MPTKENTGTDTNGHKPAYELFSEVGKTGLARSGGAVREEFLPQLQGDKLTQVLKEMRDNDPVVGAILFSIDKLIRQVDWRVKAKDDKRAAIKGKEFIESCKTDMSQTWADCISEILGMLVFGWSYHEIVYKRRIADRQPDGTQGSKLNDGFIGWKKWAIRAQETRSAWQFDDVNSQEGIYQTGQQSKERKSANTGSLLGMWQSAPPTWSEKVFIPIEKALLFRTSVHKNNPEGRSILRNAYRPWHFKKRIEEIEGVGVERDLAGFPIMYVDPAIMKPDAPGWMKEIYNQCKEIVVNVRRDQQEGAVIPAIYDERGNKLFTLELLSAGGSRQFDTSAIIQRYDQRIAMTVLADFIMLGHERVGSFALSSDKTDLFAVTLQAWLIGIRDVINQYAIPRLWAVNGFPEETMPTMEFGDIETPPIADIAAYITALAGAGVPLFPNDELEQFLMKIAGLPEPSVAARAMKGLEMQKQVEAMEPPADNTAQPPALADAAAADAVEKSWWDDFDLDETMDEFQKAEAFDESKVKRDGGQFASKPGSDTSTLAQQRAILRGGGTLDTGTGTSKAKKAGKAVGPTPEEKAAQKRTEDAAKLGVPEEYLDLSPMGKRMYQAYDGLPADKRIEIANQCEDQLTSASMEADYLDATDSGMTHEDAIATAVTIERSRKKKSRDQRRAAVDALEEEGYLPKGKVGTKGSSTFNAKKKKTAEDQAAAEQAAADKQTAADQKKADAQQKKDDAAAAKEAKAKSPKAAAPTRQAGTQGFS